MKSIVCSAGYKILLLKKLNLFWICIHLSIFIKCKCCCTQNKSSVKASLQTIFNFDYLTILLNNSSFPFQGICPGNRLKVIPSYDPGCYTPVSPVSSPCPSIGSASFYHSSSFMMHSDLYENTSGLIHGQKHGKRRSWHIMPNKVSYVSGNHIFIKWMKNWFCLKVGSNMPCLRWYAHQFKFKSKKISIWK